MVVESSLPPKLVEKQKVQEWTRHMQTSLIQFTDASEQYEVPLFHQVLDNESTSEQEGPTTEAVAGDKFSMIQNMLQKYINNDILNQRQNLSQQTEDQVYKAALIKQILLQKQQLNSLTALPMMSQNLENLVNGLNKEALGPNLA